MKCTVGDCSICCKTENEKLVNLSGIDVCDILRASTSSSPNASIDKTKFTYDTKQAAFAPLSFTGIEIPYSKHFFPDSNINHAFKSFL